MGVGIITTNLLRQIACGQAPARTLGSPGRLKLAPLSVGHEKTKKLPRHAALEPGRERDRLEWRQAA